MSIEETDLKLHLSDPKPECGVKRKIKACPKTNKEKSKEHRERRKEYITKLELQVKQLNTRIEELIEENKRLKEEQIPSPSVPIMKIKQPSENIEKLKIEENFIYDELPKMIKIDPSQIRLTMIERSLELIGNYGTERIKYLKERFRDIINNIVSLESKTIVACLNHISVRKWVAISKAARSNRGIKNKSKRIKISETEEAEEIGGDCEEKDEVIEETKEDIEDPSLYNQTEEPMDSYSAQVEDIISKFTFSDTLIQKWAQHGSGYKKEITKLKIAVRKIVRARNELLNALKRTHDFLYDTGLYNSYTLSDYISIAGLARKFKDLDVVNPFILWGIPKKQSTSPDSFSDSLSSSPSV